MSGSGSEYDIPSSERNEGVVAPLSVFTITKPKERKETLINPMAITLLLTGLSPDKSIINRIYRAAVFVAILAMPITMFLMSSYDSLFPFSTLAGVGVISIVSWASWPATVAYMGDLGIEDVANTVYIVDKNREPEYERTANQFVAVHGWFALLGGLALTIVWIIFTWIAFGDVKDATVLLIIHSIVAPFSIFGFVVPLSLFSLCCNLLRLQGKAFINFLSTPGSSTIIKDSIVRHSKIVASVVKASRQFTRWVFPTFLVFSFSLLFQIYGYWQEDQDAAQYNGSYYIAATFAVLVFTLLIASAVTSRMLEIRAFVSDLYVEYYDSHTELSHFMTYLNTADVGFKVFGITITPAMSAIVIYLTVALSGGYIHQAAFSS